MIRRRARTGICDGSQNRGEGVLIILCGLGTGTAFKQPRRGRGYPVNFKTLQVPDRAYPKELAPRDYFIVAGQTAGADMRRSVLLSARASAFLVAMKISWTGSRKLAAPEFNEENGGPGVRLRQG